ncbi:hypothetical protein Gotur_017796 [Gossypium turneri]
MVQETSVVSDLIQFKNPNTEKYFLELQGRPFIQERGFEPLMILCNKIWTLVRYHSWKRFYITPKETAVISVVQEFYASFRDQEIRNRQNWDTVTVRGEKVPITPREIYEFYDDIDMKDVINYLSQGKGTWNRRPDTDLPTNFRNMPNTPEFSRLNGLRAPNCLPDMFGQTQTHHGDEEDKANSKNKSKQDLVVREEDDYEAAFQPQYSKPKRPII